MILYLVWGLPNEKSHGIHSSHECRFPLVVPSLLETTRAPTVLAGNASVGQVCALELLEEYYYKSNLRHRVHPLAYSDTYKTQVMDHLAHQPIGVVASNLFLEPMSVPPRQISDHSQSIVSGTTTLAHPTSVVLYPCFVDPLKVDASQQPPLEMLHSRF
jgi:hypothetical protein